MRNTFKKSERLNSKTIIDKLFAGGNGSYAVFPLRVVYMPISGYESGDMSHEPVPEIQRSRDPEIPVSVLISVPKRRFHNAVDRNRFKRLVREAYRVNKGIVWNALEGKEHKLAIAFICITDTMPSAYQVNKAVVKALVRIAEKQNS